MWDEDTARVCREDWRRLESDEGLDWLGRWSWLAVVVNGWCLDKPRVLYKVKSMAGPRCRPDPVSVGWVSQGRWRWDIIVGDEGSDPVEDTSISASRHA